MNLYQCQEKAKEIGFDRAKFIAFFPAGPVKCQWLDAYMGMLKVDTEGLREGFMIARKIDEAFPDLVVTEPTVD